MTTPTVAWRTRKVAEGGSASGADQCCVLAWVALGSGLGFGFGLGLGFEFGFGFGFGLGLGYLELRARQHLACHGHRRLAPAGRAHHVVLEQEAEQRQRGGGCYPADLG